MTKLDLTKTAVSIVTGMGATRIVSGIIRNNTNPKTLTDQVTIMAESFVLGSMIADISSRYTDAKIDEIVDWWKKNVRS